MSDSRAFGYIFGSPDTGHRFFGIKTDKAASQVSTAQQQDSKLSNFMQVLIAVINSHKITGNKWVLTFQTPNL
jgi:hypothetical protein